MPQTPWQTQITVEPPPPPQGKIFWIHALTTLMYLIKPSNTGFMMSHVTRNIMHYKYKIKNNIECAIYMQYIIQMINRYMQ